MSYIAKGAKQATAIRKVEELRKRYDEELNCLRTAFSFAAEVENKECRDRIEILLEMGNVWESVKKILRVWHSWLSENKKRYPSRNICRTLERIETAVKLQNGRVMSEEEFAERFPKKKPYAYSPQPAIPDWMVGNTNGLPKKPPNRRRDK
jgi:hypothetical protein